MPTPHRSNARPAPSRADNPFARHCLELLAPLGPGRMRRMFGGYGIYVDELFIALIFNDELYLKADATSQSRFMDAGCEPFLYGKTGPDGQAATAQLNYYRPPEETLESPALMQPWGRLAMEAALRAANAKAPKASKVKRAPARSTRKPPSAAVAPVKPSRGAARKKPA
ncbi:MAG: TfoX/Sxy family protein [Burkholderiaceae bacterium]